MNENPFEFKDDRKRLHAEMLVVFVFLVSMGFPGSYAKVFGGFLAPMFEYASFLAQIVVMLLMSGNTLFEIKLLDIKERYAPIYQYIIIVVVQSMLVTASRSAELVTCVRLTVTILFAIWLVEHFRMDRIVELICIAQILMNVAIAGMILLRPDVAFAFDIHALRGLHSAKNAMASELAFGSVAMFMNLVSKREKREPIGMFWLANFGVQIMFLFMAQSVGMIITTLAIILFYLFFRRVDRFRLPIGWIHVVGSLGFLLFVMTILPMFAPIVEMLGKDITLTGRTELWDGIYRFMQKYNMLTGFGYGQFWTNSNHVAKLHLMFDSSSYFSRMTYGGHNQIMELWLNIGLIGIASYFAMILLSLRNLRHMDSRTYLQTTAILLYLTICGLTERVFEDAYSYHILSFFLVMAAGCFSLPGRVWTRREYAKANLKNKSQSR